MRTRYIWQGVALIVIPLMIFIFLNSLEISFYDFPKYLQNLLSLLGVVLLYVLPFIGIILLIMGFRGPHEIIISQKGDANQTKEIKIRCMKCGALNPESSKHCNQCGEKLTTE